MNPKKPRNIFDIIPEYTPRIGVMGSASGWLMHNEAAVEAAREIGREIARGGAILVNGACPGLPDEAAKGAKQESGQTLGVSPAISICAHVQQYKSPIKHYDAFIFTGLGLMVRDIMNIRSSNAVIILPGGTGTLNEFTVAYDEGKPIGVLTSYEGVADHIKDILKFCRREVTDRMVFSDDPKELVQKLMKVMLKTEIQCQLDGHLIGENGEVTRIENEVLKQQEAEKKQQHQAEEKIRKEAS